MSETGGDILGPGEGGSAVSEALSEEAKQRFAAAAKAMQAIQREEKRSKKRDTRVARAILQFLNDDRYAHLFPLISRLVARDCPSVFIIAVLSLIDAECQNVVQEYLQESGQKSSKETVDETMQLMAEVHLDAEANRALVEWITRMQMVLALDTQHIMEHLMVDEGNIDGTVLQLTTVVLQEFFRSALGGRKNIPSESLQPLGVNILQAVFEPFIDQVKLPKKAAKDEDDE
jgi:hypothetical protein